MSIVQTEGIDLTAVEESELGATTPPTTGWFRCEPNSFGNFGPSFKTVPRDPISKNQQLRKGMLVDEDSGIPFETDFTKDVVDRFGEGMFRGAWKHCGGTGMSLFRPTGVTSTGYTVGANGALQQRTLIFARNFTNPENNGLKLLNAGSTGTEIKTSGLVAEASPPANATVDVVGFRFATSDLSFDVDGNLTTVVADFTTMGLTALQGIVVGGRMDDSGIYSFATDEFRGKAIIQSGGIAAHKLTLTRRAWEPQKKAFLDLGTVATQLDTVVEAQTSGVGGNSITVASVASGTPAAKAELDMDAVGNSAHINTIVRAKLGGTAGNSITVEVTTGAPTAAGVLTEVGTHVKIAIKITATASTVADVETLIGTSTLIEVKTAGTGATSLDATDAFDSVALTGGTAATAASVTEVGSAVTLHYTSGATTVAQMEAAIDGTSTLIEVKTPGTQSNVLLVGDDDFSATNLAHGAEGTDTGAGKTIEVYFSKHVRNVPIGHDDYKKPSWAFEVAYPNLGENGETEHEYILGNMIDECVFNFPTTAKSTINLTFVGTRSLNPTTTRKAGPADALEPSTDDGVSTSVDLQRLIVDDVDDVGIGTDFMSLKITQKNNISPRKQLGKLGARDLNQGKHTVMAEADVYFTTDQLISAVKDRRDARLDILSRNADFGALYDLQALTLDSADKKLERDKSVQITSKMAGHQYTTSTDALTVFGFLPALPEDEQ